MGFTAVRHALAVALLLGVVQGVAGCTSGAGVNTTGEAEPPAQPSVELRVQAASSLTGPLTEIVELYSNRAPAVIITTNFDSSGTLQAQIENGAPADVFISAAVSNMDVLQEQGLILDGSRRDLLENSLVVVAPTGSPIRIESLADLADQDFDVLALGDPTSVPAGKYGRQALESAAISEVLSPKTVFGKNVKAVISYVETKDADVGIVFATDALASPLVDVILEIDPTTHGRIVYPVGVVSSSAEPDAAANFVDFLSSSDAIDIFEQYGFKVAD